MFTSLIYIAAFVFVLSLVVIVHEGGHFFMARRCGVYVTDFSIGFGRELFGRTDKHGTRWKVCLIPLGGYVKMLGDEDAASAKSSDANVPQDQRDKMLLSKPLYQRALIIFAGPAMNYIFAFLLLAGLLWIVGDVVVPPVVGGVLPGSAAERAGILPHDRIVSINGVEMTSFADIQRVVRITEYNKDLDVVLARDEGEVTLRLRPTFESPDDMPKIGVSSPTELELKPERLGFFAAVKTAATDIGKMTIDTLQYIKQILFDKRSASEMRGPLGIAELAGDAVRGGWLALMGLIIQISVALGLMNLLPVPLLDGGHLLFFAIEGIRGKPMSEKAQNAFMSVGIALLLFVLAYTMILDVPRIFQRMVE